jgi:DNA-binding LacI/PurR family transcriptional regulator/signal transduction histidine kinase/DNA-binding NarL/FixJ family response regulator
MKDLQPAQGKPADRELTIALLGTNLYYEIPISIFRAARELTQEQNYRLLYFSGEAYRSSITSDIQANILYNLISPRIADGMIIISNLLASFTSPSEFRECCLKFHPLPVVSLGMAIEGIPSVVLDNTAGMYDAVCHLIEVHHYSRIAFLSGPPQHPDVTERFAAFSRAMKTHGLVVEESLLLQGNFEYDSGTAAVRELLDIKGKIPGRDVQAIVCCNDYMAATVMLELQRRGILIPEEIALAGFDDIQFTECLIPPLSTVHYPFDTLTAKATEILIRIIKGKTVPEVVSVSARFIPRRSCGCPDAPDHTETTPFPEDLGRLLKNTSTKFQEHINRQIIKSVRPTLMVWKQALLQLYSEGKWNLLARADDSSLNRDRSAWGLLGRIAYNTFNNANYQNIIYNMGSALTSTVELPELLNILIKLLPEAEIRRCCICLYENPENHLTHTTIGTQQNVEHSPTILPHWSRLILAFSKDGTVELPPDGLRFATAELLPAEIVRKQGWKSWVVLPLYFNQEQLGYMLMDSEAPHEHLHWNLRNQISSALKGARLLEETRRANILLKEANEQKTQFFINVAHETKTPLTLIRNYLLFYLEQHPPDEHLEVIKQNIDMLLVNMLNFLDVEKLQKGNTMYQHDTLVDLSESARKKCALFRGLAKKKNIRITVNAENSIFIRIDTFALDRIFNNLLDNAVKYIHPGGRVTVDVWGGEGRAVLRISDNGPGLPVDTYEHIFEPYYLLSQKKTSKQGIGVGLSIVKKIIDEMDAAITVEKSRGGGACFTIIFEDSSAVKEGETIHEMPATIPSSTVSTSIKERNISPQKTSLLIVDDNVQLLQFMQASLEETYNVFLARDVPEAHFKLKNMPRPDLIIADIMMDGADGFMLLEELSAREGYNDIPFIFLTAMSGEKERIKGLGMGAVDYIEKPFSIEEIRAKIESIIALRRRQEKQDIEYIKSKIDGIFPGMEQHITGTTKQGFDSICKKYGVRGREPEIIRLLLSGLLHKEIAAQLNISLRTVEYHISKIYKKCGVNNKYDLFTKFQD